MVDLSSLNTSKASDKGAEIEILHPTTNKPLGIFITVLGKDSQVFREHMRDSVNASMRKQALAQRRGKVLDPVLAEQVEREAIELLALCTKSWRESEEGGDKPTLTFEGSELECNPKNAITIYTELLFIRRQIDDAVGDLENFIKS